MNIDELLELMQKDEQGDQEFMTPVAYSHVRPISSPQIYQWIRNGTLPKLTCQCGKRVVRVKEADELLRAKGKLPPVEERYMHDRSEDPDYSERESDVEDQDPDHAS